jgi:hypothetical protein
MKYLILLLLLPACTEDLCIPPPSVTTRTPVTWEKASLPKGVLAESDISTGVVQWSRDLENYPVEVVAAVVFHEWCHQAGYFTEYDADCCAAEKFYAFYGAASTSKVILFWGEHRKEAVLPWMLCGS